MERVLNRSAHNSQICRVFLHSSFQLAKNFSKFQKENSSKDLELLRRLLRVFSRRIQPGEIPDEILQVNTTRVIDNDNES